MVYKARKRPDGVVSVGESEDRLFGGQPGTAEAWTKGCQRTVQSESEYDRARDEGWRDSHARAMEFHEGLERAIADAAAYRAYEDRNMGEKAKAEAEKHDEEAGIAHVPAIPEARLSRKRGRPARGV